MKFSLHLLFISTILAACSGEDRSGEQPFPPTVAAVGCTVEGNIATLKACVTSSPNSSLKQCGFNYGNDTLRLEAKAAEPEYIDCKGPLEFTGEHPWAWKCTRCGQVFQKHEIPHKCIKTD